MTLSVKSRWLACGSAIGALALFYGSSAAAGTCETAAIQASAPAGTVITSATPTAAPVPHCRVEGYITTTNPGPNKVNFRLQLPDTGWAKERPFSMNGHSFRLALRLKPRQLCAARSAGVFGAECRAR